jgi:tetratricopeptide (TPR) repeat protein
MPARFRKSINLGGGVKLNLNKKSVSVTGGTKGAHYTVSSTGKKTTSAGIPGTGLSYRSTSRTSAPNRPAATQSSTASVHPSKPGLFAAKGEKLLYRAVTLASSSGPAATWMPLFDEAATFPAQALAAHTMAGLCAAHLDPAWALPRLAASYSTGELPENDPFFARYIRTAGMHLDFDGAAVTVEVSRELVGLALVEIHDDRGELALAVSAAAALPDNALSRLIRADLAVRTGHPDQALASTDGLTNSDDLAVVTLAVRAAALRALGHPEAAVEVTKEALRYPSRAAGARHRARLERGRAYLDLGQPAKARTEFERVLAEDSAYPGVADLIAKVDEPHRPT